MNKSNHIRFLKMLTAVSKKGKKKLSPHDSYYDNGHWPIFCSFGLKKAISNDSKVKRELNLITKLNY